MKSHKFLALSLILGGAIAFSLIQVASVFAAHVTSGPDVKVTNDNNNVDGGTPNPSFDAQNRQSNETTVAISPVNASIVAAGANDYRMSTVFGDAWLGLYVSPDAGATWFNTMVPGFPSDTSTAGLASPLLGLDGAGDPTVRFDAAGNLYVAGIAFNRDFDKQDLFNDTVVFVAKYNYTFGTPGGTSTPNSAANPPNFTYAFTTIVDRGAVGYALPSGARYGFAGKLDDKSWMAIDRSLGSPCYGNVYYTFTKFTGLAGAHPIVIARSSNGGATFSEPILVSQKGQDGSLRTQGSYIGVGSDGAVYVAYRTFQTSNPDRQSVQIVKSVDCGKHFGKAIAIGTISTPQAPGVAFRTPTFAFMANDDTNPNNVYVGYQNYAGDYDIYVHRSTDGGLTWGSAVQVNEDPGAKHQVFPTFGVSNGALHVAWYDFRHSATAANEALDVYYACTNCAGNSYPTFSHNVRVTDVSHNGNCLLFGGGTGAFHGDYIELAVRYTSSGHTVHLAWTDNRDVSPCDLDPAPGPASNNTGNRNQNIYADTLIVAP